jgi:hypothetical protein
MTTVCKILGESDPEFSEQFKDTLVLIRSTGDLARTPLTHGRGLKATKQQMKDLLRAYETKHGESKLATSLEKYLARNNQSSNFWFDLQSYLLFHTIKAITSDDMPPFGAVDTILHGGSLEGFSLKPDDNPSNLVILKAIADSLGVDVESVMSAIGFADFLT